MNEKEFDKLIQRVLSRQASQEEDNLLERWLAARSEKDPFAGLSAGEREKIRGDMLQRVLDRMAKPARSAFIGRGWQFGVAAAVVMLCVFSLFLLQRNTPLKGTAPAAPEKVLEVRSMALADGSSKVMLSDSTIVWLKGNSSITYPETFSGPVRSVELTGEALFEVSKDAAHPFIIQCGGLTAKVLGTSFNIASGPSGIEVLVLTGKVALSSKNNESDLIVARDEKAVYREAGNQLEKIKATKAEQSIKTAGTEYTMQFVATRMEEIIGRIEAKFDVEVLLTDNGLNNCTITADFTDQSLDRTLSMICQTLEITYEKHERSILLKGRGCD